MCLPLCLNSELLAQQEKKVEAADAVLKWSQNAAVLKGGEGGICKGFWLP